MKLSWLFVALLFFQDDAPFKPMEEFEVKLDFQFKERPRDDPNKIELNQTHRAYERSKSTGVLPYLYLNLRVLKESPEEVRVRVVENGATVFTKKFDMNTVLKLDMGFTDDIKDRVSPHEYIVYYLSKDKKPLSKVVIFFEENGTYIVNGQVRGKL